MDIGKTSIIRQIANNINLFTGREGVKTHLPHVITPIADIYKSGIPITLYSNKSVTGVGNIEFFKVPDNEWWTIDFMISYVNTGTYTISRFTCIEPLGS